MKELNLTNLSRPEAFQTGISKLVRKTVFKKIHNIREPLLDACCGNGLFLLEYCSRTNEYTHLFGVDLDAEALETAGQLFRDNQLKPPDFLHYDVLDMPFPENTFNTIFCLNTLVNIYPFEKIEKIIETLYRLLMPGGVLYIDFRNKNNPVLNYKYQKNLKHNRLSTHAHRRRDFENILKKIKTQYHNFFPIGSSLPIFTKGYLLEVRK
ncbi:MAG: class I SAM-dependent methyltransferase [Candidatus Marinimicrobia bacterium]|nr:class I SAM-dependent methyltransferase [Candidatus Neomarinimicrobiota bacterium]